MTIDSELIRTIRSFNRFYTSKLGILNPRMLDTEFSLIEGRIIFEIGTGEKIARELTTTLSIDEGYLSRIINKFEKSGLLKRSYDKEDRRRRYLQLTAKGLKVFKVLNAKADIQIDNLLQPLSEAERIEIAKAVQRIQDLLG